MFENKYPYTDFHELNLDWILSKITETVSAFEEFTAVNQITYGGEWDITKSYTKWTVVYHDQKAYISTAVVPAGIDIANTDYWSVIVDYGTIIDDIQSDISDLQGDVLNINTTITTIQTNLSTLQTDLLDNGIVVPGSAYIKIVGSTDYPTIVDVTNSITDGDFTIIMIPAGYYDFPSLYPAATYSSGYVFPENTYIMGMDSDRNNVQLVSGFTSQNTAYSPINCQGNFGLYNVYVNTYNSRYCVHDDFGEDEQDCTRIFKNCYFEAASSYYHAVGGNLRPGNYVIYENCKFCTHGGTNIDTIYYHNHTASGYGTLKFKGCNFLNRDSGAVADVMLSASANTPSNAIDVTFENCSCHSVAITTGAEPLTVHSDTDIPILYSYDYSDASMPRFESLQIASLNITQGQVIGISTAGGAYELTSDLSTAYGVCCKMNSTNYECRIVRMGSYCSVTELGLSAPASPSLIYVDSSGKLTLTADTTIIGVANMDGTARLYDRAYT